MKLYDVEQSAQHDIIDENRDTAKAMPIKKKFDKTLFEGFT